MASFLEELHEQRWDDHRFYHHNVVNQSLHFFSACTFICCYALLFKDPGLASFLAWTLAMVSRQSGHFFFEPHTYDEVNGVSHEHKEEVKTGYNLFRKWVLMSVWAGSTLLLVVSPTLFGLFTTPTDWLEIIRRIGIIWLAVGVGGVLFRVIQLFFIRDIQAGLVWGTKIFTDPFTDFMLYHNAPLRLLRGDRSDRAPTADEDDMEPGEPTVAT